MRPGPSKTAEFIVAILLPPACREEVLGDLQERYQSPIHYGFEALNTLPLVIYSRARRTSDPQVLLMQAFAMYLSFLGAAYVLDRELVTGEWGLLRLAFPAAVAMFSLIVADAYAKRASIFQVCFGVGMALLSQAAFTSVALPRWVLLYGAVAALLSSSAVRLLFPPVSSQLQGVSAPAHWLERSGGSLTVSPRVILALKAFAMVAIAALLGTWISDRVAVPKPQMIAILLAGVILFQLSKRG